MCTRECKNCVLDCEEEYYKDCPPQTRWAEEADIRKCVCCGKEFDQNALFPYVFSVGDIDICSPVYTVQVFSSKKAYLSSPDIRCLE